MNIMYVAVEKETNKATICIERRLLSQLIGCSNETITRKGKLFYWDWKEYRVYNPQKILKSNLRGGNRGNLGRK